MYKEFAYSWLGTNKLKYSCSIELSGNRYIVIASKIRKCREIKVISLHEGIAILILMMTKIAEEEDIRMHHITTKVRKSNSSNT